PVVELPFAQHPAELLARRGVGALRLVDAGGPDAVLGRRQEEVEHTLLGALAGADLDLRLLLLAHHVDGELGQIANDRLDVAPDVADLGELRRLDLHERRLRELREAAGYLRLPD